MVPHGLIRERRCWMMAIALACGGAISTGLVAQQNTCSHEASAILGTVPGIDTTQLKSLSTALRAGDLANAVKIYFGTSYSCELLDLVIYIRHDTSEVRQAFLRNGRRVDHGALRGEKYLYVLVFTDAPLDTALGVILPKADTTKPRGRDTVDIRRSSLAYAREPLLGRLMQVFGGLFSAKEPSAATPTRDTTYSVPLVPLGGTGTGGDSLYVATAKVLLDTRSRDRVIVQGGQYHRFHSVDAAVANFVNAGGSIFEIGLAGGVTFDARVRTGTDTSGNAVIEGRTPRANIYLYGVMYPISSLRPLLPVRPGSLGLMLGTSLAPAGLLDDIVTGVAVGRLLGGMTVLVGVNWLKAQDGHGHDIRKAKVYVGAGFEI